MHADEPLVREPSHFEVKIATEMLKPLGTRKNCHSSGKNPSSCLYI